jgi:hypothetical protein
MRYNWIIRLGQERKHTLFYSCQLSGFLTIFILFTSQYFSFILKVAYQKFLSVNLSNCKQQVLLRNSWVIFSLWNSGMRLFDRITFFWNWKFSFKFRSFEFFLFFLFFKISILLKKSIFERTLNDQTDWTIYKFENVCLIVLSKIYLFICLKITF